MYLPFIYLVDICLIRQKYIWTELILGANITS